MTDEGDKAILLGPIKLLNSATKVYRLWAAENKQNKADGLKGLTPVTIEVEQNPSQEQKPILTS